MNKKNLSIVIPLYNEQDSIEILVNEIIEVMLKANIIEYEIILINDGSDDDSWSVLNRIKSNNKNITIINLKKNFGKSIALQVGFSKAVNKYIITMDADLQDDPKEIPRFIEKLEEYDFVCGWKKNRRDPANKTIPSKIFNFFISLMSGIKLNDFNCGFKAYKIEVVKKINLYGELHRFIPILVDEQGFNLTEIIVNHRERKFGISKFGIERIFKGFIDMIIVILTTRFYRRPGHLFGTFSLAMGFIGFAILMYLTTIWGLNNFFDFNFGPIGNRPLLFFGILLMIISIQIFSLGLISEILIKLKKPIDENLFIKDQNN